MGKCLPLHLEAQRSFVRAQLRRFGVPHTYVDDLMQEVWIVALVRCPEFENEKAVRGWLAQVCRRVAANERRTRARTLSLGVELELPVAPQQERHIEASLDHVQRRAALARLSDTQLDVLTLYAGGGISMREVAHVVGAPEPTVYGWYRAAVQEVTRSAENCGRAQKSADERLDEVLPLRALAREARADRGELVLYRHDADATLGRMGNVIVSQWRKRFAPQTATGLASVIDITAERMGGPLVLLNDLRADLPPPDAEERKSLRDAIRHHSEHVDMVVALGNVNNTRSLVVMIEGTLAVTGLHTAFTLARSLDEVGPRVAPLARSKVGTLGWDQVVENFDSLARLTH